MKRIIILLLSALLALPELMASGPLLKAVQQPTVLPPTRADAHPESYKTCQSLEGVLMGNVYTNLQCTKTLPAEEALVRAVYAAGGSKRLVYVLSSGECCNYFVTKLYLADSQGNILDNKEVLVEGEYAIVLKDFVIENGVIKVYSIKPTTTQSLAFSDFGHKFTSFTGTRCDEEYVVDGNKFKLKKRTTYRAKTYTHSQIFADAEYKYKIWNGTETISKVQTF